MKFDVAPRAWTELMQGASYNTWLAPAQTLDPDVDLHTVKLLHLSCASFGIAAAHDLLRDAHPEPCVGLRSPDGVFRQAANWLLVAYRNDRFSDVVTNIPSHLFTDLCQQHQLPWE